MFCFYRLVLLVSAPLLNGLLKLRLAQGKEIASRIDERRGLSAVARPPGFLIWIHAASVGEAQSALILIDRLLSRRPDSQILMTTGTATSAAMMMNKLPPQAIHQFYPLDHPEWVERFLDHWRPDLGLWMESELWPNMLHGLRKRHIKTLLINARLSEKSYQRWSLFKNFIGPMLSGFSAILAQTDGDKSRYEALGGQNVIVTDNLKYSAKVLGVDSNDLSALKSAVDGRPLWLYASTHEGEEMLAMRVHKALEGDFPELLTILVPRHPVRGLAIHAQADVHGLEALQRAQDHVLPDEDTKIYIADTMGELGLFYRLSPISMIGRSFSFDGGGGHNPIEAAQLNSAVLYGPHVQFQQQIFDEMKSAGAATQLMNEQALTDELRLLLSSPDILNARKEKGFSFAQKKEHVIERAWDIIMPYLEGYA